jgi:hypothetical protein
MTPNDPLSNSSFGADAYEQVFQSCPSPFYQTEGHVSRNCYTQANGILEDMELLGEIDISATNPKFLLGLYKRLLALFEDTERVGEETIKEVSNQYCKQR